MRPAVRTGAVLLLSVVLLLLAGPARAHTEAIRRSTPADRSVVTSAATIRIEFTDRVTARYATFTLRSADGVDHALGTPQFSDDDAVATLTPAAELPEGLYRLGFQVTFSDGHPQTGVIQFEISRDGVARAGSWPDNGPGADRVRPDAGGAVWPWLVGIGAVVIVGFTAFLLRARRR